MSSTPSMFSSASVTVVDPSSTASKSEPVTLIVSDVPRKAAESLSSATDPVSPDSPIRASISVVIASRSAPSSTSMVMVALLSHLHHR